MSFSAKLNHRIDLNSWPKIPPFNGNPDDDYLLRHRTSKSKIAQVRNYAFNI